MPFEPDYDVPEDRQSYRYDRGTVGCLILHGFMGSPKSSRPMAEFLAGRGITVHCPLLPGHGHWPDKLYKVPKTAWLAEADEAYRALRQQCDEIFLLGHSMGCVLSTQIALQHGDSIGVVMLAPPYDVPDRRLRWMRFLRYVMPWFYPHRSRSLARLVRQRVLDFDPTLDYDSPAVQAQLPRMTRLPTSGLAEMTAMTELGRKLFPQLNLPVLIVQGGHDEAVSPGNAVRVHEMLPHPGAELAEFPDAGHELMRPFDPSHSAVWERIYSFFRQYARQPLPAA